MDKIKICDLIVFANHGVFNEEKLLGQKFLIDVTLSLSTQAAAIYHDLTKSIHYGILAEQIEQLFKSKCCDLIEEAAEMIATDILNRYPMAHTVEVCVKKPWAPIKLPLETVSVTVLRKRHKVYIGLGSNVGDRAKYLNDAISLMNDDFSSVKVASSVYETAPWGYEAQDVFLNQVVELSTYYNPCELLDRLQFIENSLGRVREVHWGPRTIDLDILFYDDEIIHSERLIVPHPYIEERTFVLEPLFEIAPHLIHPVLKLPVRRIYSAITEK